MGNIFRRPNHITKWRR